MNRDHPISFFRLQTGLQSIYDLELDHRVDDYLITSRALAGAFGDDCASAHAREKLFVYDDGEEVNLSLYIDETVLERFDSHNPFEQIDATNVQEFCLVLEGISHFIYLAWNALHDRPVTLLEMELQAEIDKYVMLLQYLEKQQNPPAPGQLARMLFESNVYHPDLGREESKRYYEANAYARQYCRHLEERFGGLRDRSGLLAELRRFYRLGREGKVRRIRQPH